MDTSVEVVTTDALGRRTGPRRLRTNEEKGRIVEETLKPGASVAIVARAHGVNANLAFGWRRLYQKGLLEANIATPSAPLLPVKVTSPTVVPKRTYRRRSPSVPVPARKVRGDFLEIDLAGPPLPTSDGSLPSTSVTFHTGRNNM